MVVLVLRFFGRGKVHWYGTIITTVGASRVTPHVGSRQGCLGGGQVEIIGAVREGGVGLDLVVKFHAQLQKFVEILGLIGLVDKGSLEFLGESSFEGSLLCLGIIIQNCY
jgi:hypothetical protein